MKKTPIFITIVILASSLTAFKSISHLPGHWEKGPDESFIYFSSNGVSTCILAINNTSVSLKGKEKIGFHVALFPFKGKFIAVGYDVVPWEDHKNAERYVQKFAKELGLGELPIEQYSEEIIMRAESRCSIDNKLNTSQKERLSLVMNQTMEYMKTEYFLRIYKDGNKIRSPQEVSDWISQNTTSELEIVKLELSKETFQIQNK